MHIPESDWKKFKTIREQALERFAHRVLEEGRKLCDEDSRTAHERYLDLYQLLHERDRELESMFDDPRRSTAVRSLRLMHANDLVEPEDVTSLSPETRAELEG